MHNQYIKEITFKSIVEKWIKLGGARRKYDRRLKHDLSNERLALRNAGHLSRPYAHPFFSSSA